MATSFLTDSELARLMKQVVKGDGDDPCWDFARSAWNKYGYPRPHFRGKRQLATRIFYQHFVGELTANEKVLHKCDRPCCVNPRHLFKGGQRENMLDASAKGRLAQQRPEWRERNRNLNQADLPAISERLESGMSFRAVARELGVGINAVSKFVGRYIPNHPRRKAPTCSPT